MKKIFVALSLSLIAVTASCGNKSHPSVVTDPTSVADSGLQGPTGVSGSDSSVPVTTN